jgi:hypothetical protein
MENKSVTAVEWLQGIELIRELNLGDWEKAKQMEKEQLIYFAKLYDDILSECKIRTIELLYEETYKQ